MSDHSPLFTLAQQAESCPLCQQSLVIRSGKNGPFLGCSVYPQCHYIKPLQHHDNTVVKVLEHEPCPECSAPLAVKNGRYGMFIGCTAYPQCHFIVQEEANTTAACTCPVCKKGHLVERLSKYGKTFWGCDNYPQCKFIVNEQPLVGTCQYCQYPLLVHKKGHSYCAAKDCQRQQTAE